jgi:hypothetical protein
MQTDLVPRRNFKTREGGIKVGEQNKAGINLKIPNLANSNTRKTPCTLDQQEEKSIRFSYARR